MLKTHTRILLPARITIQPSHLLSSPSPSAFYISQHQDLSKESVICVRWLKYWSLKFSISPSNEYSGLIYFRIDWFDLLAVQGTLKGLFQKHSSKASIIWHLVFFIVQLSHPYMTIGKKHSFDYMDFCQQNNVSAF